MDTEARLRRRITCDVLAGGRVYKGVATAIAPHEIFVQLSGTSLPKRGCDVALQLRDAGDSANIEVRGVVSQMQRGEVDAGGIRRGVVVRVVEAPLEYHLLFDGAGRDPEDSAEVEILIDVSSALADPDRARGEASPPADGGTSDDPAGVAEADLPATRDVYIDAPEPTHSLEHELPARRVLADPDEGSPTSPIRATLGAKSEESAEPISEAEPEREQAPEPELEPQPESLRAHTRTPAPTEAATDAAPRTAPAPSPAPAGKATAAARPANAIVVYDGDKLQDVYDLLEQIGARPQRARLSGPTAFRGWDQPPKMVVVDVRDALSIEVTPNSALDGVVWIAVASSASAVIGRLLYNRGFDILVRRPVHRDALAVLLRHALHRGAERREVPRSPLGVDARLRSGRWRWPVTCTVLEISATGCRVVTREDVPLLDTISLRISRSVSGTRAISLRARVIRRSRDESSGEWALALRFEELPAEQRGRLDHLLARATLGPTSAPTDGPVRRLRAWLERLASVDRVATTASEPPAPEPEAEAGESEPVSERRRVARSQFAGEVVALDETKSCVTAVLTGRNVSTLGMRVEPHPEFGVGRRMVLAFYDGVARGTIEVAAEVVRDDGEDGMAVRFIDMEPESAARLGQLVDGLPAVESLVPGTRPLVVARIVTEPLLELREEADAPSPDGPGERSRTPAAPAPHSSQTPSTSRLGQSERRTTRRQRRIRRARRSAGA